MDVICVLFLSCPPQSVSSVSVVFDFSASLNAFFPVTLILFTVDLMRMEKKSELLMNAICVLFLLCLPIRLSVVSVVFDFNASLNDVAPVSPMPLSVFYDNGKEWIVY